MGRSQTEGEKFLTTLKEKKHMNAVAELGCAVCRRMGYAGTPAELHHPRRLAGGWGRSSHMSVIPLCPEHHRGKTGVHGLGTKAFDRMSGTTQQELLTWTLERIGC